MRYNPYMETLLLDIVEHLRAGDSLGERRIAALVRARNAARHAAGDDGPDLAKKQLLPFYQHIKRTDPARFAAWDIDDALEQRQFDTMRVKPRRTASGVATITVITKPWPCTGDCSYCPSDIRMPKSYLHDEPACQRAERAWFDPYLQVHARLTALTHMGHITDKVELIVLGGTWNDYPPAYQAWFVAELFRALNEYDSPEADASVAERRASYETAGLPNDPDTLERSVRSVQRDMDDRTFSYKDGWNNVYATDMAWMGLHLQQTASLDDVTAQHTRNREAAHRCVGLVFETRPQLITPTSLTRMRQLGATKVQVGVQSLDDETLKRNARHATVDDAARAFDLLRLFGFKIHAHFMANLLGATPATDEADYARFVTDERFQPDEVKLYPCALIKGTRLEAAYERGEWSPYTYDELVDMLAADVLATPTFTRISRMIRDFSAADIEAGSTYANLRQRVEEAARKRSEESGRPIREIRMREIAGTTPRSASLRREELRYETRATTEWFLQWVTPDDRIAGFCRLSLPHESAVVSLGDAAPVGPGEAMIREVHVYGKVVGLGSGGTGAQHEGLGKALIARAADIARHDGRTRLNVISAVGTRGYYAAQGFTPTENGLYLVMDLDAVSDASPAPGASDVSDGSTQPNAVSESSSNRDAS